MRDRTRVRFDAEHLIAYLKALDVNADYDGPDFSDPEKISYARIVLTTSQRIADGLIGRVFVEGQRVPDRLLGEINKVLSDRYDDCGAFLRRTDYMSFSDGSLLYAAEIVPFKRVVGQEDGRDRRVIATEQFLRGLTHVVRNFKMKNPKMHHK
jgi:hypothetical protein